MRLTIIGSAAGGGFPQWNCNDRLNRAARSGVAGIRPRTQSSLAASADGRRWVLFNASPDIGQQINANPELHPPEDGPMRSTGISAVVLTNADVDHVAGLLTLRERQPFALYATERVLQVLEANPIFNVLDPRIVLRRPLENVGEQEILDADGLSTQIVVESFSVPGKIALYLEDASRPDENYGSEAEDTIGLRIVARSGSGAAFYIPSCARIDPALKNRISGADCLLFDGTLYTDDEMIAAGVGTKTGKRMGHMSISGQDGTISALTEVSLGRRIFVHINNTNPVLDENSREHRAVQEAGWEVAYDGMEIRL